MAGVDRSLNLLTTSQSYVPIGVEILTSFLDRKCCIVGAEALSVGALLRLPAVAGVLQRAGKVKGLGGAV